MDKPTLIAVKELNLFDVGRIINAHNCPCCWYWKRAIALVCDDCREALPGFLRTWTMHMPGPVILDYVVKMAMVLGREQLLIIPFPGLGEQDAAEYEDRRVTPSLPPPEPKLGVTPPPPAVGTGPASPAPTPPAAEEEGRASPAPPPPAKVVRKEPPSAVVRYRREDEMIWREL